jgi:hypothetical protein
MWASFIARLMARQVQEQCKYNAIAIDSGIMRRGFETSLPKLSPT